MNKSEFIAVMTETSGLSKRAAEEAFHAFTGAVAVAIGQGHDIALVGFGTFSIKQRAARTGRNPKTGEALAIAASKTLAFKVGKTLKDAVN